MKLPTCSVILSNGDFVRRQIKHYSNDPNKTFIQYKGKYIDVEIDHYEPYIKGGVKIPVYRELTKNDNNVKLNVSKDIKQNKNNESEELKMIKRLLIIEACNKTAMERVLGMIKEDSKRVFGTSNEYTVTVTKEEKEENKKSEEDKHRIYIAGKVNGLPNYKEYFDKAKDKFTKEGHLVMSPADLPEGFDYDYYLPICYKMMDACDTVYFLSNWRDSKGAKCEYDYALEKGKTLKFENPEDQKAFDENIRDRQKFMDEYECMWCENGRVFNAIPVGILSVQGNSNILNSIANLMFGTIL